MGTCKECKYYEPDTRLVEREDGSQYEENENYGTCNHRAFSKGYPSSVPSIDGVIYSSYGSEDSDSNDISMGQDFGCNHFKSKVIKEFPEQETGEY